MQTKIKTAASSLRSAIKGATSGLIEREALADLIILAAVASEHLLVIGAPGTAKSAVVRRVAKAIGGKYFEYLLGRFTEPSELFGAIDLRKLRDGTIETETSGMLPEADVVFLDEVFLGSTAVLNTLLGVLNERVFSRGHTRIRCPLRVCVGASNAYPEDESLAAFADRFLIHTFVEPVPDSLLEELLKGGWAASSESTIPVCSLSDLDILTNAAKRANLDAVRNALSQCIRLLRKAGIELSDRRIVKSQMIIAAAAVLAGRENPSEADLWPLIYVIATETGQQSAREVLKDILDVSDNLTLNAATENASSSPVARANRIVEHADNLFDSKPENGNRQSWSLQLESLGREIDSGFDPENLPENLQSVRQRITAHIENNDC